jgi:hypothetical protein
MLPVVLCPRAEADHLPQLSLLHVGLNEWMRNESKGEAQMLRNNISTVPLDATEENHVLDAASTNFIQPPCAASTDDQGIQIAPLTAMQPFQNCIQAIAWELKQDPTIQEIIQPLASLSTPDIKAIDMLNDLLSRVARYQATHQRVSVYRTYSRAIL